ncbi:MAG TPA: class I SAM-dependent methyltransferase [Candidatus Marinimicrobia bacterium]|nr:class I SAM-dependent methyltransferase [Candidatus Neomarinimicrobiota bacterium]
MKKLWNITGHFYTLYRALPGIHFLYEREKKALADLLAQIEKQECTHHLDLGCGNGSTYDIFPVSHQITAIDHSASMLAALKKYYPMVHCIQGDILNSIPDEKYDLITLIGVSEYLSEFPEFLSALKKHLKPKGTLLFTAAQVNLANQLRRFHGHRLWLRNKTHIYQILEDRGFYLIAESHTLLQWQYLAKLVDD